MNVTQLITLDKTVFSDRVGKIPFDIMIEVDDGPSLVLSAGRA